MFERFTDRDPKLYVFKKIAKKFVNRNCMDEVFFSFFGKNHLTVTGLCKLKGLGLATNDFWESFRLPLQYVL